MNQGVREETLQAGFPAQQLYWMPKPVDMGEFAPCGEEQRLKRRAHFGIPLTDPELRARMALLGEMLAANENAET